jgi:hypothetical protein
MNESISRAAGTEHGQEFPPEAREDLIRSPGRAPEQRSTLYTPVTSGAGCRPGSRCFDATPEATKNQKHTKSSSIYKYISTKLKINRLLRPMSP